MGFPSRDFNKQQKTLAMNHSQDLNVSAAFNKPCGHHFRIPMGIHGTSKYIYLHD